MSELGVELTKAELVEPNRHRDRVKKVFVAMLDICCGLQEDDFGKGSTEMQETLISISKHPETHEDFSDVRLFLELRKFMEVCGYYDFGWKDLYSPTAKRFRSQLSAAINMAKFREDQLKLYAELNEPRVELLCALEEVNEENAQLNGQLNIAQTDSERKAQEMDEIERECEELEVEIARNNKVQAAKREEATELKKEHNELKDELATSKLALEEAQAEFQSLQTKVVSSPERRKKVVSSLHELVKRERNEANTLEEEWQKNKTMIVHISQAIKDVPETTRLVQEVLQSKQKLGKLQEEIQEAKKEKETVCKQCNEVLDDMQTSEATLNRMEEKLSHMRKQHRLKMDAALEAFESAKLQLVKVEMEHEEGVSKVEAGESEVKSMERQITAARKIGEADIEGMIDSYKKMETNVLDQAAKLMSAIHVS